MDGPVGCNQTPGDTGWHVATAGLSIRWSFASTKTGCSFDVGETTDQLRFYDDGLFDDPRRPRANLLLLRAGVRAACWICRRVGQTGKVSLKKCGSSSA